MNYPILFIRLKSNGMILPCREITETTIKWSHVTAKKEDYRCEKIEVAPGFSGSLFERDHLNLPVYYMWQKKDKLWVRLVRVDDENEEFNPMSDLDCDLEKYRNKPRYWYNYSKFDCETGDFAEAFLNVEEDSWI